VHAVAQVARGVRHVDGGRIGEVVLRVGVVTGVRRGDGLDALGQRRVPGGQRVVEFEDPSSLVRAEAIRQHDRGQHDIRLLDHLVPVDHQRVVVQQQREAVGRRAGDVPRRLVEEVVVLEMDADCLVVGDVDLLGRATPGFHLIGGQAGALDAMAIRPSGRCSVAPPRERHYPC
jgi:hypothetical protein